MAKENLYLDIHVLQTVPPSCVNRDDTGSPKTAVYGGVRRARVSSQSWKRAMRQMFRQHFQENELGVRTKNITDMVAEAIGQQDPSSIGEAAKEKAGKILEAAGIKLDKNTGEAKALFFMGRKQAENLAELALSEEKPDKKTVQNALKKDEAVDIALFGRMVADDPSLNEDACAQVAHAISTHAVENEYDYYTAVDELSPEDNAGAGMIGVIEYNSSTLYRYGTVALHELEAALAGQTAMTAKAAAEFVRAFITSMPTGKQNTFANRTLPDAVLVTLRKDQPVNLAGAFENPVRNQGEGYVQGSVKKLAEYGEKVCSTFAEKPEKAWEIGMDAVKTEAEAVTLPELLQQVEQAVLDAFPEA